MTPIHYEPVLWKAPLNVDYFHNKVHSWMKNVNDKMTIPVQLLKFSKYKKQIMLSSHTPKKPTKFSHFFWP